MIRMSNYVLILIFIPLILLASLSTFCIQVVLCNLAIRSKQQLYHIFSQAIYMTFDLYSNCYLIVGISRKYSRWTKASVHVLGVLLEEETMTPH